MELLEEKIKKIMNASQRVQRGLTSMGGNQTAESRDITIEPVDMEIATVNFNNSFVAAASNVLRGQGYAYLKNSTTLSLYIPYSGVISWEVRG